MLPRLRAFMLQFILGGCRHISDVYIVNASGSVGQYLTSGCSQTCSLSASSSAFWSRSTGVLGTH